MPLTIWPPRDDIPAHVLAPFEQAVRGALGETEERLDVRFGISPGDDGCAQCVCKVEGPPSGPFQPEEQWRWWSPIVSELDQLRDSLRDAVARRRRRSVASPVASEPAGDSIRSAASRAERADFITPRVPG